MQKRKSDDALLAQIDTELVEDEELLWVDQPDPVSVALSRRHLWRAGFGILWLFFVMLIFSNFFSFPMAGSFGTLRTPFGGFFSLFPLIFIGIGLFQVLTPVWASLKAVRSVYAITNQRAIIVSNLLTRSVQSYGQHQIQFIETSLNGQGTGDIIFQRSHHTRYSGRRYRRYTVEIGFFGVQNPREVEALMLREFMPDDGMYEKPKREDLLAL